MGCVLKTVICFLISFLMLILLPSWCSCCQTLLSECLYSSQRHTPCVGMVRWLFYVFILSYLLCQCYCGGVFVIRSEDVLKIKTWLFSCFLCTLFRKFTIYRWNTECEHKFILQAFKELCVITVLSRQIREFILIGTSVLIEKNLISCFETQHSTHYA